MGDGPFGGLDGAILREPAWAEFRRGRPAPLPRATLANESLERGPNPRRIEREGDSSESRIFWIPAAFSGVGAVTALEAGWVTTELGRQPWIEGGGGVRQSHPQGTHRRFGAGQQQNDRQGDEQQPQRHRL